MKVEDYYPEGKRWWVRLHENGGKRHEMPAHHTLEACLGAVVAASSWPCGRCFASGSWWKRLLASGPHRRLWKRRKSTGWPSEVFQINRCVAEMGPCGRAHGPHRPRGRIVMGGGASGYSRAAQAGAGPECRRRSDHADPAHSDVA
jgi:hypothetical protein